MGATWPSQKVVPIRPIPAVEAEAPEEDIPEIEDTSVTPEDVEDILGFDPTSPE